MNWIRVTFVLILLLLATSAFLQAQDSPEKLSAAANAAYQAKDWAKAQSLYAQLAQIQADRYVNWYRLGICSQALGLHQEAIEAFQKAQANGLPAAAAQYNIAATLASMGQPAKALDALAELFARNFAEEDS
jgi:tetratricopeptide (TPR) repeat protein